MDHNPERIYTPRKFVRSQAVRLSSTERSAVPDLHLEGHRIAYNPHQWLVISAGIIGLVGIVTITGGTEWLSDRIFYTIEQSTQPRRDESRKIDVATANYRFTSARDTAWMQRNIREIDQMAGGPLR
ncbi:hypothetical protein HYW43_01960 [Candidatus Daviesbacteria bacterium]|nr:hypothetical protein [Candidatus Daviesbacteria bacterium]